jgi:hypothetical protein
MNQDTIPAGDPTVASSEVTIPNYESGNSGTVEVPVQQDVEPKQVFIRSPLGYQFNGTTISRAYPKVGRNELCPCGSGKKTKKCHGVDDAGKFIQRVEESSVVVREEEEPNLLNFLEMKISDVKPELSALSLKSLYYFRMMETENRNRKTLLSAIDKEIEKKKAE